MKDHLTVHEIAKDLELSESMVREHLRDGKIPGYRAGRSWHTPTGIYEQWKEQRKKWNSYSSPER